MFIISSATKITEHCVHTVQFVKCSVNGGYICTLPLTEKCTTTAISKIHWLDNEELWNTNDDCIDEWLIEVKHSSLLRIFIHWLTVWVPILIISHIFRIMAALIVEVLFMLFVLLLYNGWIQYEAYRLKNVHDLLYPIWVLRLRGVQQQPLQRTWVTLEAPELVAHWSILQKCPGCCCRRQYPCCYCY